MVLGGTAIRPVERHGWEKVKYLLYNKDTGEVLTRTPKSWLLILIFYCIYYTCLAAFWAALFMVFYQTIDDHQPKWIGENGLIGKSPGLGLRPIQADKNIDSSLIGFDPTIEFGENEDGYEGWGHWAQRSEDFLERYKQDSDTLKTCGVDDPSDAENACKFDYASLGPCGSKPYGYDSGKPCVFLKLNRIFGVPNEPYNDPNDLPEDMPQELKDHIASQADKDQVWVNCRPEYPADIEGVISTNYYPASRGFPNYFFPYMNQKDYRSPIVAVQLDTLRPGQLIHVECRAWAKNIGYDKRDRIGIVRFEIMKRSKKTSSNSD